MLDNQSATTDGPLQVVLEVPDRDCLVSLLETISDADLPVRTESIAPARPAEGTSVTVDLDVLTDKQREAVALALESGYYRRPREATLAHLSAQLEITKSAVSQRLRTAERKLIKSAMDRYRD